MNISIHWCHCQWLASEGLMENKNEGGNKRKGGRREKWIFSFFFFFLNKLLFLLLNTTYISIRPNSKWACDLLFRVFYKFNNMGMRYSNLWPHGQCYWHVVINDILFFYIDIWLSSPFTIFLLLIWYNSDSPN